MSFVSRKTAVRTQGRHAASCARRVYGVITLVRQTTTFTGLQNIYYFKYHIEIYDLIISHCFLDHFPRLKNQNVSREYQASQIHVKRCHSGKNSIAALFIYGSRLPACMPFLATLHRCRNILARAHKRGQAEGDRARGMREKSETSTSRAHLCTCVRKRPRVRALPRALMHSDIWISPNLARGQGVVACGRKGAKCLRIAVQSRLTIS